MASDLVPRRISPWLIGATTIIAVAATFGLALNRQPTETIHASPIRTLQPVPIADLTSYAGNEACASCHAKEFATHSRSEHAHAMSRVDAATHGDRFSRPSDITDTDQGIHYQTRVSDGRCVLVANAGGVATVGEATFGFGSGKHAITYLGKQGPLEPELRLSYYAKIRRWDFSPGQQLKGGRSGGMQIETGVVKPAETIEGCFVCHSTVIAKEQDRLLTDTVMMGVGCEACHGPGKAHIAAARQKDQNLRMTRLGSLSGQQISQQLCGQCHRSPSSEDPHDDYNRSQLPRFQGLALTQSLCFTNSEGRLSCMTCHDSHDQTPPTRSFYNSKCVSCHSGASPTERACKTAPKGDCIQCHMPAQSVGMPVDLRYRTHWIKVWAGR